VDTGCRHDTCKWSWSDLHAKLDPEYAARKFRVVEAPQPHVNGSDPAKTKKYNLRLASEGDMEPVEWLWPGYLPLGKLCGLEGDPDQGKSSLIAYLAAIITTGGTFPDGSPCEQGGVIIVSAEDDRKDTLKPRLTAAGADLSRIALWTIIDKEGNKDLFELPRDLGWLEQTCDELSVKLIVLDPFEQFVPKTTRMIDNQSVRQDVLVDLAMLAANKHCIVYPARHLNKDSQETNPLYRGAGSVAVTAMERAVYLVAPTPEDPELKVFACVKNNLARKPPSLGYRLDTAEVVNAKGATIKTSTLRWQGVVNYDARALLIGADGRHEARKGGSKVEQVAAILRDIFADGAAHESEEVMEELKRHGKFSAGTIATARRDAGIEAKKNQFRGGWKWYPPEDSIEVEGSNVVEPWDEG
jgi:putative DNA primase/helicase